jgi:transposase
MQHHGWSGPKGGQAVEEEFSLFVGIDWATEAHQVFVVDAQRRTVGERKVEHSGPGIAAFVEWLGSLSDEGPGRTAVAIEIPRGAIVETLVERGFAVFAINPKQLDRFRDRYAVAGAKDDRRDAFVLADSLRTDQHCFHRVRIDDPVVIQLREVSRADDDLREEMNRLTNRLREQLHRFFPQVLRLSPSADEPWVWALLELVPTPDVAARTKARAVDKLLRQHRIRRVDAPEVLATLQTPALTVAPGVVQAATAHIALLLPRLRLVHEQRKRCAGELDALLDQLAAAPVEAGQSEHRDVEILRSLPGVGRVVSATVLAEASWALAERDYHALRGHSGVAPVTRQSGKRRVVGMRNGCNARLRNALYHWARVASQHDDPSRRYYAGLRARGHTHGRALRSVADRLLRILVAMLRVGTLYDAQRAARSLAPEAA